MNNIRLIILLGQLGRIFGKTFIARRNFSAIVAIGFYALFRAKQQERENIYEDTPINVVNDIEEDEYMFK